MVEEYQDQVYNVIASNNIYHYVYYNKYVCKSIPFLLLDVSFCQECFPHLEGVTI